MEPMICYAPTSDGVSIAYCTLGEGSPLVCLPTVPCCHLQREWEIPEWRRWHERLAEGRLLVRFDSRGTGLSEREAADFSLEAQMRDLEAVVDRLGLEAFALIAAIHAGPTAVAYAAAHPERVRALVLWHTYSQVFHMVGQPRAQTIHMLLERDWELFTETIALAGFGWSDGESAQRFAAMIRAAVTPEVAQAAFAEFAKRDLGALLPDVRAPTLILHRTEMPVIDVAVARELAAAIPDARLALLPGSSIAPWLGEVDGVIAVIDDFLDDARPVPAPADGGVEPLSARELEVLRLIATGLTNQEIAERLVVSVGTVKTHINNIFSKLSVGNRTRAVARGCDLALLD